MITGLSKSLFVATCYLLPVTCYLISPSSVFALKQRVKPAASGGGGVAYSSVKLRPDRLGVNVTFINLSKVKEITYTLTYIGNGVEQGVRGSLIPTLSEATERELLFATCSKNICTWHNGIQNMKLYVTTTTKTGRTTTKLYKIRP